MQELKSKARKSMTDYLNKIGWKHGDDRTVFNELPNMWRQLETDGLMDEIKSTGMTYQHFLEIAKRKHKEKIMREQMEAAFGNMGWR